MMDDAAFAPSLEQGHEDVTHKSDSPMIVVPVAVKITREVDRAPPTNLVNTGKEPGNQSPTIDRILSPSLAESTARFDTIWTHYKGFTPDPTAEFTVEFARLADHQRWDESERKRQRPTFIEAEFSSYFGHDAKSLANWQKLCRVCKVREVPESIQACEETLKSLLINIVNLVNSRRTGEGVIIFPDRQQFIEYTWPDRIYPLNKALEDSLLTALLQPVHELRSRVYGRKNKERIKAGRPHKQQELPGQEPLQRSSESNEMKRCQTPQHCTHEGEFKYTDPPSQEVVLPGKMQTSVSFPLFLSTYGEYDADYPRKRRRTSYDTFYTIVPDEDISGSASAMEDMEVCSSEENWSM
ncbi:hypothetical protein ACN47E_005757 [Coniothyrium glycines]